MKNITHLLDVVDGVRDHIALGLMSDPGLSKTAQVKQWAEKNERRYCELIISQRMPSEISGMPMPIQETRKMEVFDFETLLELEDGDVLAFDEFTNGNIQTLNACLTLIQERTMLSGHQLPSLLIVAMGNPQGKCDLLPQTKQRFWWVDVKWDANTWSDYIFEKWNFTPTTQLTRLIGKQYQDGFGTPSQYNYYTPRTIENLLRIAQVIPPEDSFWSASNLDGDVVSTLYKSIASVDRFREIQRRLTTWVREQAPNQWVDLLLAGLDIADNMAELRAWVTALENEGIAPEFIRFMKNSGDVDE